jgi:hypothetical protein
VSELIDTVQFVALMFVVLLVLGAMREILILRREVNTAIDIITVPPRPPYLGKRLPDDVQRALEPGLSEYAPELLLFLSEGCNSCVQVLKEIERHRDASASESGVPVRAAIVTDQSLARRLLRINERTQLSIINDAADAAYRLTGLRGRPSALRIEWPSRTVVDYTRGVEPEWLRKNYVTPNGQTSRGAPPP